MLYNFAFDNNFYFIFLSWDSYSFAVLHGALYTCFLVLPHSTLSLKLHDMQRPQSLKFDWESKDAL